MGTEPRTMRDDVLDGRGIFGKSYVGPSLGAYMVQDISSKWSGGARVELDIVLYEGREAHTIPMAAHFNDRKAARKDRLPKLIRGPRMTDGERPEVVLKRLAGKQG